MNEEISQKLNVVRSAFNTTTIAQEAAIKAVEDNDFLNKVFENNLIIKNDFVTFLQNNNFKVYDSETNFVLVEVPMKGNDAALHLRSEEHTSELQSRGHLVCSLLL